MKMTPRDFCYWFDGVLKCRETDHLSYRQVQIIKAQIESATSSAAAQDDQAKIARFCDWAGGLLECADSASGLPAARVATLQERLEQVRTQEIEPTFGRERERRRDPENRTLC